MRDTLDWREEPIGRHHDRKGFDCGSPELNAYLKRYARQNHESGGAKTFVAVPPTEPARVLGYYSISPGAIEFARVPARLTKKLGRYDVPVFRLGRLAVSLSVQGQGLGGDLLLAAGERALAVAAEVGGVALAIDAKDERAARWYERFGAMPLLDNPLKLILPLSVIAEAVAGSAPRPARARPSEWRGSRAPKALVQAPRQGHVGAVRPDRDPPRAASSSRSALAIRTSSSCHQGLTVARPER